jgi:PEGA domain
MRKLICILTALLLSASVNSFAADTVLTWPATGNEPLLRFTVSKMRQISAVSGQSDYLGEALAENLSAKPIPAASFYVYLIDKHGKRVGEGYLEVTNLGIGQKAKVPVSVHAMGSFATMELQPQHLPSDEPMKIKMSVTSTPPGATVKLDSQDSGVTPALVGIPPGKHTLEFVKEGYTTASTPVEINENAMPGSVKVELTPLALDTVVLRDGSVLLGNVSSVTPTSVAMTVKGKAKTLDRSRVARVVFAERKHPNGSVVARKSTKASLAGK